MAFAFSFSALPFVNHNCRTVTVDRFPWKHSCRVKWKLAFLQTRPSLTRCYKRFPASLCLSLTFLRALCHVSPFMFLLSQLADSSFTHVLSVAAARPPLSLLPLSPLYSLQPLSEALFKTRELVFQAVCGFQRAKKKINITVLSRPGLRVWKDAYASFREIHSSGFGMFSVLPWKTQACTVFQVHIHWDTEKPQK